jgi:hypothetical protein
LRFIKAASSLKIANIRIDFQKWQVFSGSNIIIELKTGIHPGISFKPYKH